jgi:hypothetical protein
MKNEFVSYEQAVALKELGFKEPCLAFYNGKFLESSDYDFDYGTSKDIGLCIVAPIYQQAFRWFREKYDLFISITHYENGYSINDLRRFDTYEEAELACIKKLIEIVK